MQLETIWPTVRRGRSGNETAGHRHPCRIGRRTARTHTRWLPDCAEAMGRPAARAIIGDYDPGRKNAARSMVAGGTDVMKSLAAVTITEPLRVRGG